MTYGINIDDIDALDDHAIQAIRKIPFRTMARVVIDEGRKLTDYEAPVTQLSTVADVMIQVEDSANLKNMSTRKFITKTERLIAMFGEVAKLWEVGNEVSGDWLPRDVWEKTMAANEVVRRAGLKSSVCFFLDDDLEPFLKKHDRERGQFDVAMISCYPGNASEMQDMAERMPDIRRQLVQFTSASDFQIGEYGANEWKGAKNGLKARRVREQLINCFEAFNGGYYWSFQQHILEKPLMNTLIEAWRRRTDQR